MLYNILVTLLFLGLPALVLWCCHRVPFLGKIGPILILYILGILIGNTLHPQGMSQIQTLLSNAMVPLAIPLMLFGCTFRRSETRSQLLALLTGLVAVVLSVIGGYLLFGHKIEEGAKIGGMLTGVYTGGTINLASLKTMLGVHEETFILLNSYDMVISFLYLTFLLAVGIKLFRRILPNETYFPEEVQTQDNSDNQPSGHPYRGLFKKDGLKDAGFQLGITLLIIGIGAGLGLAAGDTWFMVVFILTLTTLGIAASFWKKLREKRYGYDIGMYFIYVFSVVVASMADLSQIDLAGGLNMLWYLCFVIFGSLLLQVVFARIFRIDADIMTVSSVAFICSPPFVPMMSAAMRNKRVLVAGLSIGIVGYALGNYLGFLISKLLPLI